MAEPGAGDKVRYEHEEEPPLAKINPWRRKAMMEELRLRFRTIEPRETRDRDRRLPGKRRVKARKEQQRAERRAR
jgi:hypothetical protein